MPEPAEGQWYVETDPQQKNKPRRVKIMKLYDNRGESWVQLFHGHDGKYSEGRLDALLTKYIYQK